MMVAAVRLWWATPLACGVMYPRPEHDTMNTSTNSTSTPLHNFAARCPHGHLPSQKRTLTELRSPAVQFYCGLCGQSWTPESTERLRALGFAEASEEWTFPNTAA